jgi:hypothetical protein
MFAGRLWPVPRRMATAMVHRQLPARRTTMAATAGTPPVRPSSSRTAPAGTSSANATAATRTSCTPNTRRARPAAAEPARGR